MTKLTPSSSSENWSELLAGYVLGDLTPAEISIVEEYLAAHPEQQAEVASLRQPLELFSLSLPANLPPAALRQSIMQLAANEAVTQQPVIPAALPNSTIPKFKLWLAAIAGLGVTLCTGLGWQNYHLSQELAQVRQDLAQTKTAPTSQISPVTQAMVSILQQPNNRFLALKSMGRKTMGMGSLVMAPYQASAVLTLQKVPPIPAGKVYRVWAILGEGEMACGDFVPDASGQVLMQLPFDRWGKVSKVTITIEDKNSDHAQGEIAIEGESEI
jgi:Anti-sigma-K factor rskA